MIIESTTLDTQDKVIEQYGGERWIQHSGYVLRGATSGVTSNTASKTGGNDSVSYTPAGSNSGMGVTMNAVSLSHSGGAVQNHTLTATELPKITGSFTIRKTTGANIVIEKSGCFTTANKTTSESFAYQSTSTSGTGHQQVTYAFGGGGAHNHGFTQPNKHDFTPTAKSYTQPKFTGTKATINTLPQYKSVYIWERVE